MLFLTEVTEVGGGGRVRDGGKEAAHAKVHCAQPCASGNGLKTHFIQGCDSECDS